MNHRRRCCRALRREEGIGTNAGRRLLVDLSLVPAEHGRLQNSAAKSRSKLQLASKPSRGTIGRVAHLKNGRGCFTGTTRTGSAGCSSGADTGGPQQVPPRAQALVLRAGRMPCCSRHISTLKYYHTHCCRCVMSFRLAAPRRQLPGCTLLPKAPLNGRLAAVVCAASAAGPAAVDVDTARKLLDGPTMVLDIRPERDYEGGKG